ncbi:MAG: PKD domain-containing protein [Saprospiraceae bacterium]|nr:PKD domain-containing protein [Saprospiraceae bacterium]MCB9322433.1 PKD domain-containing protein [Lewinellaceae bacterium]
MKHLIENAFLLILIILGGAGMTFSFTSSATLEKDSVETSIMGITKSQSHTFTEDATNSILKIRGIQEVGAKMQFEVKSFNSNAHYLIDFGNGEKKAVHSKKEQYTYKDAGDFNLKLYVTYNGKTKLAHSEIISIDNQIVASAEILGSN